MPRRRADLLFRSAKVAVFIDGCFWHGCSDHGVLPKSNAGWWEKKIAANRERDADSDRHLRSIGWTSLRFWEHDPAEWVADQVEAAVRCVAGPSTHRTTSRSSTED